MIDGYDARDPTSMPESSRSRILECLQSRKARESLRIGVPQECNIAELKPVVRGAWTTALRLLQSKGHTIHLVSLPSTKTALSAYYILAPAEASSNLAKYDGVRYGNPSSSSRVSENVLFATTRGEMLGAEVRRRILLGAYTLSASAIDNYFIKAQKVRRLVKDDFDSVFALQNPLRESKASMKTEAGVDCILSPTAPSLPPTIASLSHRSPLDHYRDDVLTVPASLAGLPAMSVPLPVKAMEQDDAETTDSVGISITAQYGDDDMVFHVGKLLEEFAKA